MPVGSRLLDTTILVDVFRNDPQAIAWVNSLPPQGRSVSVITYFELLAGCRNRREQQVTAREMRTYRLLILSERISRTALSWYRRFFLSHGVGFLDALIGATAVDHGLSLATLNTKHFTPLPGLRVERPYG
jgi:predicted nucleic acid-binding protein